MARTRNSNAARTKEKSQAYYHGPGHDVVRKQQQSYITLNRDRVRDWKLKSNYGVPYGTYARMLEEQKGGCAICGKPEYQSAGSTLFMDHNHITGEIRSLLCSTCNFMIGHGQESSEVLKLGAAYLEKWKV